MCGIVAVLPAYVEQESAHDDGADLVSCLPGVPAQVDDRTAIEPAGVRAVLEELLSGLSEAVRRYSRPAATYALVSDSVLSDRASASCRDLGAWTAALDRAIDAASVRWTAEPTESVQALLRQVNDQLWLIEHDRVLAAQRARALAASRPVTARGAASYSAIETVLSAIDRLEVRGRDSAGMTVWVSLGADDLEQAARIQQRDPARFRNAGLVRTSTGACFTYKRAAVIGGLGENVAALRSGIENDDDLHRLLTLDSASVTVIAHTRWASVGRISEANAHPVNSCDESGAHSGPFAVAALNGDIDNYAVLAKDLHFRPDERAISTDAKVIPLSLAAGGDRGSDAADAMVASLASFAGSMAIAAQMDGKTDELALAVKGSGQSLYVGMAPAGFLVASETYGLVGYTQEFFRVSGARRDADAQPGVVVTLRRNGSGTSAAVDRRDGSGATWPLDSDELVTTEVTTRDLSRGSFEHYLLKEILEAPASFSKTLRGRVRDVDGTLAVALPDTSVPAKLREALATGALRHVVVIGQGTAAVACQGIVHVLRSLAGERLTVTAMPASEFSAWHLKPDLAATCVVAVSQSGSTTDTNRSVDLARERGALVISIVNRRDSDLAAKSDGVMYTSDGRDVEMSVASTKAFYAQVAAGCLLSLQIAKEMGVLQPEREASLLRALARIPAQLHELHDANDEVAVVAKQVAAGYPYWSVVGSGPNRVAAEELRIKLSELCYKTISADAVEDKKHIDLSAEALVLVCAAGAPPNQLSDLLKEVDILKAHGNRPVVFCDASTATMWPADLVVGLPEAHPDLGWILSTAAGHLFAYHAARAIDATADHARDGLSALERAVDSGLAANAVVPRDVLLHVEGLVDEAWRGDLRGVLSSRTALQLARLIMTPAVWSGTTGEAHLRDEPAAAIEFARTVLSAALEELARPVDTVKHQAKTVTVGTSRDDANLYDNSLVEAMLAAGADQAGLPLTTLRVLRAITPLVEDVTGVTRYELYLGGGEDRLKVLRKTGSAAELRSRADNGATLTGSKRRVVKLRAPRLLRGRADGRVVLAVPEQEAGEVSKLAILHVALRERVRSADLLSAMEALGDRLAEIEAAVTETTPAFDRTTLGEFRPEDALLAPIDEVVDMVARETSRSRTQPRSK